MRVFKYLWVAFCGVLLVSCQAQNSDTSNAGNSKGNSEVRTASPDIIPPANTPEPKPSVINNNVDNANTASGASKQSQSSKQVVKGDPVKGKQVYAQCLACHNLQRNSVGPRHCGVFGRKAGGVDDFDYSQAMQTADRVWDYDTLDAFIAGPQKNIPGNLMFYPGISSKQDRLDIIAYFEAIGQDKSVCP